MVYARVVNLTNTVCGWFPESHTWPCPLPGQSSETVGEVSLPPLPVESREL